MKTECLLWISNGIFNQMLNLYRNSTLHRMPLMQLYQY